MQDLDFISQLRKHLADKQIWFVRHGQATNNVKNADGLLMNTGISYDPELTDEGIAGAQKMADKLRNVQIELAVHSPSLRARHTAEIIMSAQKDQPKLVFLAPLHESNTGDQEGDMIDGSLYDMQLKDMPGAESPAHLFNRAVQALEFIARQPENVVLIASHARIGCMLMYIADGCQGPVEDFDKDRKFISQDTATRLEFRA